MKKQIRVAVFGELPTACNYLLENGVVQIDHFLDATEITDESAYHLILIYAPHAEGLMDTQYAREMHSIPIRLLNEPCCRSALVELKSTVRRIERRLIQSAQNSRATATLS